jgi:maltose O-acetyltransferase
VPLSLRPSAPHVGSRAWSLYVNGIAASPLIDPPRRARIYRRFGIALGRARVFPGCYIHSANLRIGDGALVNHGAHIENIARIEIGARTAMGQQTMLLTSSHEIGPHDDRAGEWGVRPVTIGAGCWIGARSVVLPGVTIADGCVIAAGSVVRADCEPDGLYAGVPAKRIRDLRGS